MKEYLSVKDRKISEYVVMRSRFIATIAPVADAVEADEFVKEISQKYPDATHNCYAYIADSLGNVMKFSDDGEPQGTAGQPMLEVLRKQGLRHVAVVVTRYFGGVKLGAGGLVGAYTKSVSDAVSAAKTVKYKPSVTFEAKCDYTYLKNLQREISSYAEVSSVSTEFSENVTLRFSVPTTEVEKVKSNFVELTSGNVAIDVSEEKYACFEI